MNASTTRTMPRIALTARHSWESVTVPSILKKAAIPAPHRAALSLMLKKSAGRRRTMALALLNLLLLWSPSALAVSLVLIPHWSTNPPNVWIQPNFFSTREAACAAAKAMWKSYGGVVDPHRDCSLSWEASLELRYYAVGTFCKRRGPEVCELGDFQTFIYPKDAAAGPKTPGGPSCPANTLPGGTPPSVFSPNPINLSNGNKFHHQAILEVPSTLNFSFSYNSTDLVLTAESASHWRHVFEKRINRGSDTGVPAVRAVSRDDGKRLFFQPGDATGAWKADADINERLVENVDSDGRTIGYRLLAPDGGLEHYDANGRLERVIRADRRQLTLARDASGELIRATDDAGRTLAITANAQGQITELRGPADEKYAFSYDTDSNLTTIVWPDASTRVFPYEGGNGRLTGIVDENGKRFATYRYLGNTFAMGSDHASVETYLVDIRANGENHYTTVTDPLGTQRTYFFRNILGVLKPTGVNQPGGSGCAAAASAIAYDANGNVSSRTDFNGVVTTYQYDLSRNLETSRTEAAGTAEARTITTVWHPYWRQPIQIREPGRTTTWAYNGDNGTYCAPTSATVPSLDGGTRPIGVVCEKTVSTGGDPRAWRWTYNAHGRPLTENGPRTDVADTTTHDYWPIDATCPGADLGPGRDKGCRGERASTTNALGHVTRFTRYNAHGQLEESIDPNGVVTTIAHDLRQRPVSISVGGETTTYAYDAVGQLIRTTLPDGNVLTQTWDDAHRLTGIADAAGNRVVYTLDAAGNRIGEDFYDGGGQLARAISRSIDALGRVQAVSGLPFLQP